MTWGGLSPRPRGITSTYRLGQTALSLRQLRLAIRHLRALQNPAYPKNTWACILWNATHTAACIPTLRTRISWAAVLNAVNRYERVLAATGQMHAFSERVANCIKRERLSPVGPCIDPCGCRKQLCVLWIIPSSLWRNCTVVIAILVVVVIETQRFPG